MASKKKVSESVSLPATKPSAFESRTSGQEVGIKSGYLFVKLPPTIRGNSWKAWTKKWVVLEPDIIAATDSITNSALLTISKHEKTFQEKSQARSAPSSQSHGLFRSWLTPQKTVVFRCKSRTQMYSFTICESAEPVIHFSANCETQTQEWIYFFRTLLWPPTPFIELEKTLGSIFEVSIIDNEFSHRAGLLGMYGHLSVTSKKVILAHPQTGHVIQEWYLNTVSFKLLPQSHPDDINCVLTMITDAISSTGYGTIVMYCKNGDQLIARIHEVRQMFEQEKSYGDQMKAELMSTPSEEKKLDGAPITPLSDYYTYYKVPNKPPRKVDIYDPPKFIFQRPMSDSFLNYRGVDVKPLEALEAGQTLSLSPGSPHFNHLKPIEGLESKPGKLFSWRNVANIPESMLNCSISDAASFRAAAARPVSESSSGSSSGDSKVDFYIGEVGDEVDSPVKVLRKEEEGEKGEEEEEIYAELQVMGKIVEEETKDGADPVVADLPPALPPKKRSSRKDLVIDDSCAQNKQESDPKEEVKGMAEVLEEDEGKTGQEGGEIAEVADVIKQQRSESINGGNRDHKQSDYGEIRRRSATIDVISSHQLTKLLIELRATRSEHKLILKAIQAALEKESIVIVNGASKSCPVTPQPMANGHVQGEAEAYDSCESQSQPESEPEPEVEPVYVEMKVAST